MRQKHSHSLIAEKATSYDSTLAELLDNPVMGYLAAGPEYLHRPGVVGSAFFRCCDHSTPPLIGLGRVIPIPLTLHRKTSGESTQLWKAACVSRICVGRRKPPKHRRLLPFWLLEPSQPEQMSDSVILWVTSTIAAKWFAKRPMRVAVYEYGVSQFTLRS
jgi:hypothetical protein